MEQTPIPKWQVVTGWVLSGILAFVFLPSAFFKIAQPAGFLEPVSSGCNRVKHVAFRPPITTEK